MSKRFKFILTFSILNVLIATVWYVVELITIKEIQESSEDTVICLALSFLLSIIINSKIVQGILSNSK